MVFGMTSLFSTIPNDDLAAGGRPPVKNSFYYFYFYIFRWSFWSSQPDPVGSSLVGLRSYTRTWLENMGG